MTDPNGRDNPRHDGPFEQGYAAWNAGVPLKANPHTDTDADDWDEGWLAADQENDQFGVGA